MSYVAREIIKNNRSASYVAADSGAEISKLFGIAWLDEDMLIDIVATAAVAGAGVSATLQDSSGVDENGVQKWNTVASVSITGAGVFTIDASTASRKLRPLCRVILTVGAGGSATLSSIRVCGS